MKAEHGFSLVELLIASGLTIGLAAVAFSALGSSQSAFALQTERADLQQRLRVVVETLAREIEGAGAGPSTGRYHGPLTRVFAAALPYRLGAAPAPGNDILTLVTVPPTHAQSTLAVPFGGAGGTVQVQMDPGCPATPVPCGFAPGMTVATFDGTGAFDVFTVRSVAGSVLALDSAGPSSGRVYPAGSGIAEVQIRTFWRRTEPDGSGQLVRETGIGGAAVPVVDHVVRLSFEYFGDPRPPVFRSAPAPGESSTTYGPIPPPPGEQTSAYPPGENCVFGNSATGAPRLPVLAADAGALVRLSGTELSDGPWCPDAFHPLRFDADLLRVRRIGVTVRVESADAAFRGPAGLLFTRSGTSREAARLLPDGEVQVSVAPPNLALVLPP